MTNDEIVHRYLAAYVADDTDALGAMRHADWSVVYPQSGERVRGHANMTAIMEHYPGGAPTVEPRRVVGTEDRYVLTPMLTFERIVGGGDAWWAEGLAHYPDGSTWHTAVLLELVDGLVHRETAFYAEPFDPPAWRAAWVEPAGDGA